MSERTGQTQRGIAIVEFALIIPIFLVLVFGIFEGGMAFWRKQELTSAVREGARAGIVATTPRKTLTEVTDKVKTYMTNVGMTDSARVVTCPDCPCTASGNTLTVTATYPTSFQILSRLAYGGGIAATKTISATVKMQCE